MERVSTFQGGAVVFLEDVQANRALGHTWLLISCGGSSVWQLKERWKEYIYSYTNLISKTCQKKALSPDILSFCPSPSQGAIPLISQSLPLALQ